MMPIWNHEGEVSFMPSFDWRNPRAKAHRNAPTRGQSAWRRHCDEVDQVQMPIYRQKTIAIDVEDRQRIEP